MNVYGHVYVSGEPDPAVRRHLLRHAARLLHPGQLWREDHDGHHHPQLTQHLPVAGRRDQPTDVASHAAHRSVFLTIIYILYIFISCIVCHLFCFISRNCIRSFYYSPYIVSSVEVVVLLLW